MRDGRSGGIVAVMALVSVLLVLLVHLLLATARHRKGLPRRPNIVFLLADDLGWGDVNYNGGQADTPNLNAMATGQNSVQFRRFYSGSPVCSPTRGTVLTGRNHNRYCVWKANTRSKECNWTSDFDCPTRMPLPPYEVTVAEMLKTVGYRTAAFGKWHLGDLKYLEHGHPQWSPSHPGQHGFDVWKVTERAVPTVNPNCACFDPDSCRIGHYRNSVLPACTTYFSNNISCPCMPLHPSPSPHPSCHIVPHSAPIMGDDSLFIVNQVKSFIDDSVARSQPFFAYLAFHSPHSRYIATRDYADKYSARGWNRKERDYFGTVEALDHAVGQVIQHLHRHGVAENTMVWFTSDNGPAVTSPGSTNGLVGRKGSLMEGGIRVPGILQWPGVIQENRVSDYLVSTSDFLPTVMEITGTELPDSRPLDGVSILPHLLGAKALRTDTMYWAFKVNGNFSRKFTAVSIQGDLKLYAVYKNGDIHRSKLFNVTVDERTNIAHLLPEHYTTMRQELTSWTRSLASSATSEAHCLSTDSLT